MQADRHIFRPHPTWAQRRRAAMRAAAPERHFFVWTLTEDADGRIHGVASRKGVRRVTRASAPRPDVVERALMRAREALQPIAAITRLTKAPWTLSWDAESSLTTLVWHSEEHAPAEVLRSAQEAGAVLSAAGAARVAALGDTAQRSS